jgi:hypothetical protein
MGILDYIRGFLFLIFIAFLIQKISNISFYSHQNKRDNVNKSNFPEQHYVYSLGTYQYDQDEQVSTTVGHIATRQEIDACHRDYNEKHPPMEQPKNEVTTGVMIDTSYSKNPVSGEWERD